MKRNVIAMILMAVAIGTFARGNAEENQPEPRLDVTIPVSEQLATSGPVTVTVRNMTGSVRVSGGSTSRVTVTGMVGEDVVAVDVREVDDNRINIEVVLPEVDNYARLAIAAMLEITIPRSSVLGVRTMGASVDVTDITGAVEIQTVTGSIAVSTSEDADIVSTSTVTGDTAVSGPFGSIEAQSVMSDVVLTGFTGAVHAATTGGRITVRDAVVTAAELRTGMGQIDIDCDLAHDAALRATTAFGGSIEMTVPESFAGLVTLAGGVGAVDYSGFQPSGEIVTVFEDNSNDLFRALPGIDFTVTVDGGLDTDGERTIASRRGVDFEVQAGLSGRGFSVLGRDLYEFRVGDGDARIFLDCQGAPVRVDDRDSGPVGIVLKTRP